MKAQVCPFCNSSVSLVDSAKVYGRSYGFIYLCDRYPHCDARVGCHPGSNKPLGTLADKELRRWRNLAHYQFDPLWKSSVFNSRSAAYKWLAKAMKLPPQKTHIAMFDKKQCQTAIGIIQQQFWEFQGNIPLAKKENDMKPSAIALSVDNGFDIVAVWEREGKRWKLLQLARPGQAIALYQENSKGRLVFPTGINPNHLESKIFSKGKGNNWAIGAKR